MGKMKNLDEKLSKALTVAKQGIDGWSTDEARRKDVAAQTYVLFAILEELKGLRADFAAEAKKRDAQMKIITDDISGVNRTIIKGKSELPAGFKKP